MTEARKKFAEALSELLDKYDIRVVEPASLERKIDDIKYKDWAYEQRLGDSNVRWNIGRAVLTGGLEAGEAFAVVFGDREDETRLMDAAPDLAQAAIDHINDPGDYIYALKKAVIKAGFGCDIEEEGNG